MNFPLLDSTGRLSDGFAAYAMFFGIVAALLVYNLVKLFDDNRQ